jgi:dihydroorotate dehydrogenase electron transfer subunit
MVEVFREIGVPVALATEDGSVGQKGYVTEIVIDRLRRQNREERTVLLSCGPTPFLKAMQRICADFKAPGQISLETMMGCGFGICMGCPVRSSNPTAGQTYQLTCMDGPVFDVLEVALDD